MTPPNKPNSSPELTEVERAPTHRCKECDALWIRWPDGYWSLYSHKCGPCCDNVSMGDQIELLPDDDPRREAVLWRKAVHRFRRAATRRDGYPADLELATVKAIVADAPRAAIQALATKNELPSEIEELVERLPRWAENVLDAALADDLEEAAQAILSLQRRLESVAQFALDLAGGRVMGDGLDELRRRADAALNPKDTSSGS
jgi:hypothetical protein